MKKLVLIFALVCFAATSSYAVERNLYKKFKGKDEIKVFLGNVISEAKSPDVRIDTFKKIFKEVVEERLNIKFVNAKSERDADVVIDARIKDYVFTEQASPSLFGPLVFAADALTTKSAASLTVDYDVIDPSANRLLLVKRNFNTVAKMPVEVMKGEKGFVNAVKRNANRFIFRTFCEQRKKR